MYLFFSILIVLACVLLIGAVLIQKSKGAGLASNYAEGNQFMGYRKTTDFIEKATWGLAIFICVLSILSTFVIKTPIAVSSIKEAPAATSAPAPAAQPAPANQLPAGK
jgi:preprotein translocase subunit SecG